MALCWCAAGMVGGGKQLCRVNRHLHLPARAPHWMLMSLHKAPVTTVTMNPESPPDDHQDRYRGLTRRRDNLGRPVPGDL